ncbi:unnamed protein product, partial [marine sediment metagenome]
MKIKNQKSTRSTGSGLMLSKVEASKIKNSFTLIELLVVISIIGIIAGIFWGTMKVLSPSLKLTSVVRDLATDIRYAQQLAVT